MYRALTSRAGPATSADEESAPVDRSTRGEGSPERRRTWWWIGVGALLSVLMRLRMLWTPLNVDEGGYLAIARAWSHGRVLYRDVWVDRPQGLLVLFRAWDWLSGGSTGSIRVMAMLFGVVLVVATAVTVWELVGPRAARWAALVCGVVSAAPVLEAHTANGELLSGAVSAAGLAIAVVGLSRQRPLIWLFGSGVLAGIALSLKQSGFDGLFAIGGWLVLVVLFAPRRRGVALRLVTALFAGSLCVPGLLAVHGALTGWSRWWTAVAGYRLRVESSLSGAEWVNLRRTFPFASAVLGSAAVAAAAGTVLLVVAIRRRDASRVPSRSLILVLWVATSSAAFFVGGGFWRHYWLLLAAPLSALAGVALSRAGRVAPLLLATLLAPCLAVSAWVFTASGDLVASRATEDPRPALDVRVAHWLGAHREPGHSMYVLCYSAALYAEAHEDPGYPYLWYTEVRHGPHARELLVGYLGDPVRAPRYVVRYQSPSSCDPSGQVDRILARDYHWTATVAGIAIYQHNDPLASLVADRSPGVRVGVTRRSWRSDG